MAKFFEHKKALELRKEGKSYNQIKQTLRVSKSTLSYWLHDAPLSSEQMKMLRDWNEVRIEKFRETWRKKKELRLNEFYEVAKKQILPLSERELHIAGLFLYWGEGLKGLKYPLMISNTNPTVIQFSLFWMNKILKISKESLRFKLHLYSDMDIEVEHQFWAKILKISLSQFKKPYIKQSSSRSITYATSSFWHGTCEIYGGNIRLKERVMMELKAVSDVYKTGA